MLYSKRRKNLGGGRMKRSNRRSYGLKRYKKYGGSSGSSWMPHPDDLPNSHQEYKCEKNDLIDSLDKLRIKLEHPGVILNKETYESVQNALKTIGIGFQQGRGAYTENDYANAIEGYKAFKYCFDKKISDQ